MRDIPINVSEIIEIAWCDKTSFYDSLLKLIEYFSIFVFISKCDAPPPEHTKKILNIFIMDCNTNSL